MVIKINNEGLKIFNIIKNLYTAKNPFWIDSLEDKEIQPYIINLFLGMNKSVSQQSRYLNNYVFYLSKKQWLFLAWYTLPKTHKAPFVPYIKKQVVDDPMNVFWDKIQRMLKISNNDMPTIKKYLEKDVSQNKSGWFKRLGMSKNDWLINGLDYQGLLAENVIEQKSGLEKFGF